MLHKETTREKKEEGIKMIKNTGKKKFPINDKMYSGKCRECEAYKAHSSSNMSYLCGKCYLKKKHEMRLKKGLK